MCKQDDKIGKKKVAKISRKDDKMCYSKTIFGHNSRKGGQINISGNLEFLLQELCIEQKIICVNRH